MIFYAPEIQFAVDDKQLREIVFAKLMSFAFVCLFYFI